MSDKYAGLSAIERMDLQHREHAHARDLEEIRARGAYQEKQAELAKKRSDNRRSVGVSLAVSLAIASVGFFFFDWMGNREIGPSEAEITAEREKACLAEGGTWLPKTVIVGEEGMCLLPGTKRVEAP